MAISLEAINTLVWRYLNENGFQHTAFLFKSESMFDASDSAVSHIPSGSLISLLQKSLQYLKLEKRINKARNDPEDELHDKILEIEAYFPEPQPKLSIDSQDTPEFPSDQPISITLSSSIASILTGHKKSVFTCSFSPDGSLLGTGGEDGTTIIWKMRDGTPFDSKIINSPVDDNMADPSSSFLIEVGIPTAAFDSTGKYFATGSFDSIVRLYTSHGVLIDKLCVHKNMVFSIKFSPSGQYLVSCSADKTAILWSVPDGSLINIYAQYTDTVLDASWRNNNLFATACADNNISLCHINGRIRSFTGHTNQVTAVSWNNNKTILASASEDSTIRLWKIGTDDEIFQMAPSVGTIPGYKPGYPIPQQPMPMNMSQMQYTYPLQSIPLVGHESGVSCIEWVPNSDKLLVSAAQDFTVRIWDTFKGVCLNTISHHTLDVTTLACSPDGKYIASGSKDQTIDILDARKGGELVATFVGSSSMYDVKWDPSGRHIAVCFDDSTVAVIPTFIYLK